MRDIIDRLREFAPGHYGAHTCGVLMAEAANEIELLRAALECAVTAMRAPLDGWKGELERKALAYSRKALMSRQRDGEL